MPTFTLKNIPSDLYAKLKASAVTHRRSLNMETIVILENALEPSKTPVEERLREIKEFRDSLGPIFVTEEDINAFKNEGRP